MPVQPLVVVISTLALLVAIGSFLSSRQAACQFDTTKDGSNLPGLSSITPTPCCRPGVAAHSIKCFTGRPFLGSRAPGH